MILTIIIITSIVSAYAFRDYSIMSKLQFNAYRIVHNREWYRLFSHALLHGGWIHLIINMLVLYSFGNFVISAFGYVFQFMNANLLFILYYVFAVAISSLYSVRKHRNNVYYNAVGASGAVSAVVFTAIFFEPYQMILFFGILPIPGIVFGILYLVYSYYMSKKGMDNIGHDAHFYGAIFGLLFPILLEPKLIKYFLSRLLLFNL